MRIAFVDTLAPRPYDARPETLVGLGGTESTLVRIAEALRRNEEVELRQSARTDDIFSAGLRCLPFRPDRGADHFVVINAWKVALLLRRRHPDAAITLWLHVFPGRHNRAMGAALARARIGIVCVSGSHARWLRQWLPGPWPQITHIPNPVADALAPDSTPRDPDLLLFASAPHKGLNQVYERFAEVRAAIPALRLEVADPGYLRWRTDQAPRGVRHLGALPQADLHARMRRALCLFYPQTSFAETFGLVIAEANALGCPVLVHRGLGANDEVASTPDQCVDAGDSASLLRRLRQWRAAPPRIETRPCFRLRAVAGDWANFLHASRDGNPTAPRASSLSPTPTH